MSDKYLKWLNLLPLIMFFIVDKTIVGVFVMLLYGVLAAVVAAVGTVVVVIKDRIAEKKVSKGLGCD